MVPREEPRIVNGNALIYFDNIDLEETGLKGNPSVATVVFNRAVKYDGILY